MAGHKQSISHSPETESPCFSLTDSQRPGDLSNLKSFFEKLRGLLQHGRTQVVIQPSNTRFISQSRIKFRLKRKSAVAVNPIPQLLKMHFELSALFRRVIFGSAQGNDRIESVLTPRRAALPTVRAGVMDEQDRNSSPS